MKSVFLAYNVKGVKQSYEEYKYVMNFIKQNVCNITQNYWNKIYIN